MRRKPKPVGKEKVVYQGKIVEVVHQDMDVGKKIITFEHARRSPGTRLIIVSPEKKILLTKEYRTELKNWDFRLPGGKVFDLLEDYNSFLTTGNNILKKAKEAAVLEAEEEVGIRPIKLNHFCTSKNGATVQWDLFYFAVDKYKELPAQNLELGERIEINWYTAKDAKEICLSGKMHEDRSVGVLLRFLGSWE